MKKSSLFNRILSRIKPNNGNSYTEIEDPNYVYIVKWNDGTYTIDDNYQNTYTNKLCSCIKQYKIKQQLLNDYGGGSLKYGKILRIKKDSLPKCT